MSNDEESLLALLCESLGGHQHQVPIVINYNYYNAPIGQHNDHVDTVNFSMDKDGGIFYQRASKTGHSPLPEALATDEAMSLWQKAQRAGYVDDNFQPTISRTQSALLADGMAERLGIKEKWKVFETLWGRKNMYRDYYKALSLQQSLAFQDEMKRIFQ